MSRDSAAFVEVLGASRSEDRHFEGIALRVDRTMVTAWFASINGRTELVGLDFGQLPRRLDAAGRNRVVEDLLDDMRRKWRRIRSTQLVPIPKARVFAIRYDLLFEIRSDLFARFDEMDARGFDQYIPLSPESIGFTEEETRALPYLGDALAYVRAIQAGTSPISAIVALHEGNGEKMSTRTAEGRVRRMRIGAKDASIGLLTPATKGKATGKLTPKAIEMRRKLELVREAAGLRAEEMPNG